MTMMRGKQEGPEMNKLGGQRKDTDLRSAFHALSPASLIRAARNSNPAFKYATGVSGLIGIVATASEYGVSWAALVFGCVILVALMVLFLVFSKAAALSREIMTLPATILVWSVLVFFILFAFCLFTSAFFDGPLPFKSFIVNELNSKKKPSSPLLETPATAQISPPIATPRPEAPVTREKNTPEPEASLVTTPHVSGSWPMTGEFETIDRAHVALNGLENSGNLSEAQLTSVFRNIFNDAFFRELAEEVPPRMLFVLIRTHLLLNYYVSHFADPIRREAVRQADMKVLKLLGHIERLYPVGFSVQGDCYDVLDNFKTFQQRLPQRIGSDSDSSWVDESGHILRPLKEYLQQSGFVDDAPKSLGDQKNSITEKPIPQTAINVTSNHQQDGVTARIIKDGYTYYSKEDEADIDATPDDVMNRMDLVRKGVLYFDRKNYTKCSVSLKKAYRIDSFEKGEAYALSAPLYATSNLLIDSSIQGKRDFHKCITDLMDRIKAAQEKEINNSDYIHLRLPSYLGEMLRQIHNAELRVEWEDEKKALRELSDQINKSLDLIESKQ